MLRESTGIVDRFQLAGGAVRFSTTTWAARATEMRMVDVRIDEISIVLKAGISRMK